MGRASDAPPSQITAAALVLSVPGHDRTVLGGVSAPPAATSLDEDWTAPDAAAPLTVRRAFAEAVSTDSATTVRIKLRGVKLFGGEVRIGLVDLNAHVDATAPKPLLVVDRSVLDGVRAPGIADADIAAADGPLEIATWGTLSASESADDSAVGLRLTLTAAHGGLPAGAQLTLAVVSLPDPPPVPEPADGSGSGGNGGGSHPPSPTGTGSGSGSGSAGGPAADGGQAPTPKHSGKHHTHRTHEGGGGGRAHHHAPPAIRLGPHVRAHLTRNGFVFPVFGPVSFSDDFGAPRADTIWHHGNDIFAAKGAPILAVTSGTLHSVGWNTLGGRRLWLRADDGSVEFYYAHLSAYAALAVEGSHVRAGQVIGFVGNTGDAAGTPYHLHFEVHPAPLARLGYDGVIDPYPLLMAWHHRKDAPMTIPRTRAHARPRHRASPTVARTATRLLARPEGYLPPRPVGAARADETPAPHRRRAPGAPPARRNHDQTILVRENDLTDLIGLELPEPVS